MNTRNLIWGAMAQFEKIGARRMARLKNHLPDPEDILNAPLNILLKSGLEEPIALSFIEWRKKIDFQNFSKTIAANGIKIILLEDSEYPALLREISDPPQVLFVRGNLSALRSPLAVVGTRKMTGYGKRVTEDLVAPLSRSGASIVSGLALGIDAMAHKASLGSGGHTVAVLGSGVDDASIYPASNKNLAAQILAGNGAIISEFAPRALSLKHHFPVRNRIIAGMTLGTLVIEADIDSGSLITARAALDENRDVFAVPGDIYRQTSHGTNNLLKMGARVVSSAEDIASVLNVKLDAEPVALPIPESPEEAAVILCLKKDPKHIDTIAKESQLDIPTVSAMLTFLEMKGAVRNAGNMHYALAR